MASTRKNEQLVKNFVSNLTDNDLQFVTSRLFYQYQDDLYEVFDFISTLKKNKQLENSDVDYWLGSAKNYNDFYKQVDALSNSSMREYEKRGGNKLTLI